jgi:hypothetical protein
MDAATVALAVGVAAVEPRERPVLHCTPQSVAVCDARGCWAEFTGTLSYIALGQPLDRRRTAQPYALAAGTGETGMDALLDDRSLELSEHTEHLKQGAAGRSCGIDALYMQIEIDTAGVNFAEERHEVLKRTAQPVNGPGEEHIELAARGVLEQAVELGTFVAAFGPAHAVVDILVDDLPALTRSNLAQCLDLVLGSLAVAGRHARVEGGVSRRRGGLQVRLLSVA